MRRPPPCSRGNSYMESVGRDLKSIREERKIPLSEIAQSTKINIHYLHLLEDGRFGELPGGMYNRAFLRTYCECLGLNPTEYLERYEAEIVPPSERATKNKDKNASHGGISLRPHPLIAWGVMLLVSVVGLFLSRGWISSVFSPYFARSPVAAMPPVASSASQTPAPQQATEPAPDKGVAAQSPVQSEGSGAAQAAATMQPVPADQPADVKAAPPPPAPGTIRLEFHVLETCWVSVSSDGARVQKLLEPGEDQFFDAVERFYIILGNAGGVQLKINGKAAKPLGKSGEVVHMLINQQNMSELLARTTG